MELARSFESGAWRGLRRFNEWIAETRAAGREPALPNAAESDAVRIMSIHQSKGLEFPVVFLADTSRSFNESDRRAAVLVHPELGLGPKLTDAERGIEYPHHRAERGREPAPARAAQRGAAASVRRDDEGARAAYNELLHAQGRRKNRFARPRRRLAHAGRGPRGDAQPGALAHNRRARRRRGDDGPPPHGRRGLGRERPRGLAREGEGRPPPRRRSRSSRSASPGAIPTPRPPRCPARSPRPSSRACPAPTRRARSS